MADEVKEEIQAEPDDNVEAEANEKQETIEEKYARVEAELAQAKADAKRFRDESSELHRKIKYRNDEYEDKLNSILDKLATKEDRHVPQRHEPANYYEDEDEVTRMRRIAREEAEDQLRVAKDREQKEYEKYATTYKKEVDRLLEKVSDEDATGILAEMELAKEYVTGKGDIDARYNFKEARANYYEKKSKGALPKLKGDSPKGTGVGGASTVQSARKKEVVLDEASRKLLSRIGKDEKWAQEKLAK